MSSTQLINCLKVTSISVGLLLSFDVLEQGVKRIVHQYTK